MKIRYLLIALALALVLFGVAACSTGGGGGNDLATQISTGEQVYKDKCAQCHDQGVGPALTADELATHTNALDLHDYIAQNMPLDAPGSLTSEQYWDVTAYLVDHAGLMQGTAVLGADNAGSISLTK